MSVLSTPLTELLSTTARPPLTSSPADLTALLRRLDPAPEPSAVFKSLTRVVVPLLCDASSVWISIAGQRSSHTSFRVADSDACEEWTGPEDLGSASQNCVEAANAVVGEDTVTIPIDPPVVEGQLAYHGALTMSFHGSRPTLTHLLVGHLLVERAIALVQREQLVSKVDNLNRALRSNREIGSAMGILMARHQLTSNQAFDLLRRISQRTHRKLIAIAAEVVETGALDLPYGVDLLNTRPTPGPPRQPQHLRLAR